MRVRRTMDEVLKQFPPFLCFALARVRMRPLTKQERYERERLRFKGFYVPHYRRWRRMSYKEVAELSGLHYRRVYRISTQLTWDRVRVGEMVKFMKACSIDLFRLEYQVEFLKKVLRRDGRFRHLTAGQTTALISMMKREKELRGKQADAGLHA